MNNWEEIKFKDFITLQRGYDLFKTQFIHGNYPVIGATEIVGYHNSFKVKGPGITMGRVGSIGHVQYIDSDYWPHQDCLYVKDFKGNDLMFVYYILRALPITHLDAGGAVPALNRNHLDNIKIYVPPTHIQELIGRVLLTYDNLIKVNNKRIQLITESSYELYKEWFIRMRFPGHTKTKFIKGLPDWEMLNFGKIAGFTKGKNPSELFPEKTDGAKLYVNIEATEEGNMQYCNDKKTIEVKKGETLMIMDGSRSGVVLKSKEGILGSTLSVIRPNKGFEDFNSYLYYFLKQNYDWIESNNVGSAIPHANRRFIQNMTLLRPPSDILKRFEELTKPFEEQIELLTSQNVHLDQIRDRLQPRLISGKLKIKENNTIKKSCAKNPQSV